MSAIYDCANQEQLLAGLRHARRAISLGELVVLPTDTVYGIAADAFSPEAVSRLLDAKGRTRATPPPVLVPNIDTVRALVSELPVEIEGLLEACWPGALTVVLPAQPSLTWDLGDSAGTVALRMPDHALTRELLNETGPLAVSSANKTGLPPAIDVLGAQDMLRDSVSVYLDDGTSDWGIPSTIIDATALISGGDGKVRILREGAVRVRKLREILGEHLAEGGSAE